LICYNFFWRLCLIIVKSSLQIKYFIMESGLDLQNNADRERAQKNARERRWVDEGRQELFEKKLKEAKTIGGIGTVLYTTSLRMGKVCWMDAGQYQEADWERIEPILREWDTYNYEEESPEGAEVYTNQITLLDEFPGDAVRRELNKMLRHYTGVEKTEDYNLS